MAPNTAGSRRCTAQPPIAHSGASNAPSSSNDQRHPHGADAGAALRNTSADTQAAEQKRREAA